VPVLISLVMVALRLKRRWFADWLAQQAA